MAGNVGCLIDDLTEDEFAYLFSFQLNKHTDLNIQEGMTIIGFFEGEYGTWWEEDSNFSIISYRELVELVELGVYTNEK
jgi:hypothetical protein